MVDYLTAQSFVAFGRRRREDEQEPLLALVEYVYRQFDEAPQEHRAQRIHQFENHEKAVSLCDSMSTYTNFIRKPTVKHQGYHHSSFQVGPTMF